MNWGTWIVSPPVFPHSGTSVHVQCSDDSEYAFMSEYFIESMGMYSSSLVSVRVCRHQGPADPKVDVKIKMQTNTRAALDMMLEVYSFISFF